MKHQPEATIETVAISRIRLQSTAALKARLARGPVIVQRQGRAIAVLLDPAYWQELIARWEQERSSRTNRQTKR